MYKYDKKFFRNEKGMTLIVSLMIIMVLTLLGATAVMMTTTDLKITGNYRTGETAFYAAEAGIEEARARLRLNAVTGVIISDTMPATLTWERYIGTAADCAELGFNSGNSYHNRVDSLQNNLVYAIKIKHQTSSSGQVLYWGDSTGDGLSEINTTTGNVVYLVTSMGKSGTSKKKITVEICHLPPISTPGALYVESATKVMGSSTSILGSDQCGTDNKPGIATARALSDITTSGGPTIAGSPNIAAGQSNLNVQGMIDGLKENANYKYNVTSETKTGMEWGTPVAGATDTSPSTCSSNYTSNIVYYNTNNTYIKLSGGATGCGMLLVEGNLEINGGFSWYGVVVATGSIIFTGGGSTGKNITGSIVSGGSVDADVVGGSTSIIYCSEAINNLTKYSPFKKLSWKEEGI